MTTASTRVLSEVTRAPSSWRARPFGAKPLGRRLLRALVLDQDRAAKANHVAPAEHVVENLVAEGSVGQDGHVDVLRNRSVNGLEELMLSRRAAPAKLGLLVRVPREGSGPSVRRHRVDAERRVVVVEVRPVEGQEDLRPPAEHEPRPGGPELRDVELVVAQESVERLDAVLRLDVRGLGVRRAEGVDAGSHRPHRRLRVGCQGIEPLAVHVLEERLYHPSQPLRTSPSASTVYLGRGAAASYARRDLGHGDGTPTPPRKFRGDPSGC